MVPSDEKQSVCRKRNLWNDAPPLSLQNESGAWRSSIGIVIGLVVLVVAALWPVTLCQFVNFDDDFYITGNPLVRSGFHLNTIAWAFTHTAMGLYHPLTILSLAIDTQGETWFGHGLLPEPFHLENLLFHAINTVVLYLVMWRMTSCRWRSALAVALWAVHPLRVESVAWVVERKDELAGMFGFAAIGAYVAYARRGRLSWYLLVLGLLTLSLLAKPMMAALPISLLLLDFWPLRRIGNDEDIDGPVHDGPIARLVWLIAEKVPMLMIVLCDVHIGDVLRGMEPGESAAGSVTRLTGGQITYAITNGLAVLPVYLQKMADFRRLTVFYPRHPWPMWNTVLGAGVLAAVTIAALGQYRRRPWLAVGWLWFLVMLLPTLVVVVGLEFAMADRYTNAPSIGLAVMAAWSIPDRWGSGRARWHLLGWIALVLLQFSIFTWIQCTYWTTSQRLWSHCIDAVGDNWMAEGNMAADLDSQGRGSEAMQHFRRAVELNDKFVGGHMSLGKVEHKFHLVDQAAAQFRRVTELAPGDADGWYRLGFEYADPSSTDSWIALGRPQTNSTQKLYRLALPAFDRASVLSPNNADVAFARAETLLALQRTDDAIASYRQAIADDPKFAKAHNQLGVALALSSRYAQAADEFRAAIRIVPKYKEAVANLADAREHLAAATTHPTSTRPTVLPP
jgi:Flp pilus assembly protein TadD